MRGRFYRARTYRKAPVAVKAAMWGIYLPIAAFFILVPVVFFIAVCLAA
jgi:hypothetical protein